MNSDQPGCFTAHRESDFAVMAGIHRNLINALYEGDSGGDPGFHFCRGSNGIGDFRS